MLDQKGAFVYQQDLGHETEYSKRLRRYSAMAKVRREMSAKSLAFYRDELIVGVPASGPSHALVNNLQMCMKMSRRLRKG